jgi:hypothetical protein
MGKRRNEYKIFIGKLESGSDLLEDLRIVGRILLK